MTVDNVPHAPWLDRGYGSGAREYLVDYNQELISERGNANDGRSVTRTTFYWNGDSNTPPGMRSRDRHQLHRDPEDRRSWSELSQWNDGKGVSSRKQDNYEADISRWIQTFCGQLDIGSYQRERVSYVVENIELSSFGPIPVEHIILAVITLVVDAETRIDPDDWTPDDWIVHCDAFESLLDDVEMEKSRLWTLRKEIHHDSLVFNTD